MKIRDKTDQPLQELCQEVAKQTTGFSGADLAALCRAAAIRALADAEDDCWIEEKHFFLALETDVKASSDSALVERLENWKP
jgi:SpoVK/Ycf46/Vps4 family AAA+-type ATPase